MGNNLIRLMRRTPPTSAMSTTTVIATTTTQVIATVALPRIFKGGRKCRFYTVPSTWKGDVFLPVLNDW